VAGTKWIFKNKLNENGGVKRRRKITLESEQEMFPMKDH